jgi:hypothetical protein
MSNVSPPAAAAMLEAALKIPTRNIPGKRWDFNHGWTLIHRMGKEIWPTENAEHTEELNGTRGNGESRGVEQQMDANQGRTAW